MSITASDLGEAIHHFMLQTRFCHAWLRPVWYHYLRTRVRASECQSPYVVLLRPSMFHVPHCVQSGLLATHFLPLPVASIGV